MQQTAGGAKLVWGGVSLCFLVAGVIWSSSGARWSSHLFSTAKFIVAYASQQPEAACDCVLCPHTYVCVLLVRQRGPTAGVRVRTWIEISVGDFLRNLVARRNR